MSNIKLICKSTNVDSAFKSVNGYDATELIVDTIYTVQRCDSGYLPMRYYKIISPLNNTDPVIEYGACYFYTEEESIQIIRDMNIDNILIL